MKKLHIAMAIAASVSTAAIAQAQDYQIEGGLSYTSNSPDVGDSTTDIGLDGTYFMESVSTSGVVLNEAAFVGRNNNINASFTQVESTPDDLDETDIGVEWWFEDIYAAANLTDDGNDGTNIIRVGYMVQENTRVNLFSYMRDADGAEDTLGLEAKYVGSVGDNTINLEAAVGQTDDAAGDTVTSTMFGGDYYFSDTLSAGVSLFDSGADGSEGTTTLSVKNFFTPTISGELDYSMNAGGVEDNNATTIRAAMRF